MIQENPAQFLRYTENPTQSIRPTENPEQSLRTAGNPNQSLRPMENQNLRLRREESKPELVFSPEGIFLVLFSFKIFCSNLISNLVLFHI